MKRFLCFSFTVLSISIMMISNVLAQDFKKDDADLVEGFKVTSPIEIEDNGEEAVVISSSSDIYFDSRWEYRYKLWCPIGQLERTKYIRAYRDIAACYYAGTVTLESTTRDSEGYVYYSGVLRPEFEMLIEPIE